MTFRSAALALGFGVALGLASALALGVGAFEEEAAIVVRAVELVDPAPADPFDLDPLFAPGPAPGPVPGSARGPASAPARGPARRSGAPPLERTVELAGGDVVTIRVPDEPALRLASEDVAFVELGESALGEDGRADPHADAPDLRFAVYAVLAASGRAAWAPFAAEHANDFLLVEIGGRPVDLVRPLGWSRGLRIAVFADEPTRTRWLESLELDLQ